MLEFFVGQTVSNGRGFCDLQKEKSPELVMGTSSGLLYCLLRRNLRHCVGIDRVNYALDPAPQCEVSEYLHNAAAIGK